ncbi:hypothetical protein EB73_11510 [Mycobacterium sp. SWH-M3]|nr:hypothetical protein EB73_11510 [Mycobacterium sp. SWH-M3]
MEDQEPLLIRIEAQRPAVDRINQARTELFILFVGKIILRPSDNQRAEGILDEMTFLIGICRPRV